MEKLNNVLDKAKQAVDIACKKTGDFVGTEKKKFNIASLKNKRDKLYSELGKAYFEFLGKNEPFDEKAKDLVSAVKSKNAEIERLEEEMFSGKDKAVCKYCKKEILKGAAYCSHCGKSVD